MRYLWFIHIIHVISYITGWWFQPHWKILVNYWDDDISNIWENKKCSKPPTSHLVYVSKNVLPVSPSTPGVDPNTVDAAKFSRRLKSRALVLRCSQYWAMHFIMHIYIYMCILLEIRWSEVLGSCSTVQPAKMFISCFCSWPVLPTSHKISNTEMRREIRRVIIVGIFQGPPKLVCIILFNKHIHIGEHQKMIHG